MNPLRAARLVGGRRGFAFLLIAIAFVMPLLVVAPAVAEAPTARVVDAEGGLNLRASPSFDATILETIPDGTLLDLRLDEADPIEDTDGISRWWPVSYDGLSGWVSEAFLEVTTADGTGESQASFQPGDQASVSTGAGDGANVRAEPAVSAELIDTVGDGTIVEVRDGPLYDLAGEAWYAVATDDLIGFIRADLLAWGGDASSGPAAADNSAVYPAADVGGVPVLLYHSLDYSGNRFSVTPEQLASQCEWLVANGYTSVTLSQLVNAAFGEGLLPAKPVAITVDDGWLSTLSFADVLSQYGLVGTYFINNSSAVGPDEIAALAASGEVQAHTVDHAFMSQLGYDDQFAEIADNRAYLESASGQAVRLLAWPYGDWDANAVQAAADAGIVAAFDAGGGVADLTGFDPYHIPRIEIASYDDLDAFAALVMGSSPS